MSFETSTVNFATFKKLNEGEITFKCHENNVTEHFLYANYIFSFDFGLKCVLDVSEVCSGCFRDIHPNTQL